jgi:hypothetical protein
MRGLSRKETLIFFGLLCVLVSTAACSYIFALGIGLGMERVTSGQLYFSPSKEMIWKASERAFFLSGLFEWLPKNNFWFLTVFALHVFFYAALIFVPFYTLCQKISRTGESN